MNPKALLLVVFRDPMVLMMKPRASPCKTCTQSSKPLPLVQNNCKVNMEVRNGLGAGSVLGFCCKQCVCVCVCYLLTVKIRLPKILAKELESDLIATKNVDSRAREMALGL